MQNTHLFLHFLNNKSTPQIPSKKIQSSSKIKQTVKTLTTASRKACFYFKVLFATELEI